MWVKKIKKIVWKKAIDCDCNHYLDSINHHRVCSWCGDIMVYSEFVASVKAAVAKINAWTIGYRLPINRGGKNSLANLQAIHVGCEIEKSENYTTIFGSEWL